jgi:hypothetical protein
MMLGIFYKSYDMSGMLYFLAFSVASRNCDRNSQHKFLHNCLPQIFSRLLYTYLHSSLEPVIQWICVMAASHCHLLHR